jgi:glycosyltransferase involved in cell wall biosynthesis
MPVYNEEENLIATLDSISRFKTNRSVELLLINNNSSDNSENIIKKLGLRYINQPIQGTTFTRQAGLIAAKGNIIASVDGDTLYPDTYLEIMVSHLDNPQVTCVYTRYSFIPTSGSRWPYAFYEIIGELLFTIRRKRKDYLNVMGFCFCFRREDAIRVGGFNTSRPIWCDGWMAMSLQTIGKIVLSSQIETRVYTSDRRLLVHGNIWRAFVFRINKEKSRLAEYLRVIKTQG